MLGQGISSESIWTAFNNVTTAFSRVVKWVLKISWKRVTLTSGFATVGSALINGTDLIKGLDGSLTESENFYYFDETTRAVKCSFDKQVVEPLGGVAMQLFDVVLDNSDGRFTPDQNATIGTAILPNRPNRFYLGFEVLGIEKTVAVFKGITNRVPKEDKMNRLVELNSYDFINYINNYDLDAELYENKRTDEIIEDILNTIGFGTTQYSLDTGLNTIDFAFFTTSESALDRIKKVCESEGGIFYQDENGILKFENRNHNSTYRATPVWDIKPDDIIKWEEDESTLIVNKCTVKAKPRASQSLQNIWVDAQEEQINAGATITVWANLEDPASSVTSPASTTDYTAYTGSGGTGSNITGDISIVDTSFTTAVKLEITNNNASKAYMNLLKLRGTPAKVTGEILEIYEDASSQSKYDVRQYTIENDFIDTSSFAQTLAQKIVTDYKDAKRRLILTVQGIPQLQLNDLVTVYGNITNNLLEGNNLVDNIY